jgi:hypothetical protein
VSGEGGPKTYSIWGFVACFSLLGVVGLVLLLTIGSPGAPTEQVGTRQTLSEEVAAPDAVGKDVAASSSSTPTSTTTSTTEPSPSPTSTPPADTAPPSQSTADGVTQVLTAEGSTSYVFRAPPDVELTTLETVVAPMTVRLSPDSGTAYLSVGCARSADEFLAQVLVQESETLVTFVAIAVAPPGGAPCPTSSAPRQVELKLTNPIAGRALSVIPWGTPVPPVGG